MAKRMPTSLFVKELAAALNRGDGYIMGSYGQNPRTGYLDLAKTDVKSSWKETGWYYTQYSGSQRTQALKWRKKCTRVWDCAGMAEGIYEMRYIAEYERGHPEMSRYLDMRYDRLACAEETK